MTSPTASPTTLPVGVFLGEPSLYRDGTRVLYRLCDVPSYNGEFPASTVTVFFDWMTKGCNVVTQSPRGLVVSCYSRRDSVEACVAQYVAQGYTDVTPGGTV